MVNEFTLYLLFVSSSDMPLIISDWEIVDNVEWV